MFYSEEKGVGEEWERTTLRVLKEQKISADVTEDDYRLKSQIKKHEEIKVFGCFWLKSFFLSLPQSVCLSFSLSLAKSGSLKYSSYKYFTHI